MSEGAMTRLVLCYQQTILHENYCLACVVRLTDSYEDFDCVGCLISDRLREIGDQLIKSTK